MERLALSKGDWRRPTSPDVDREELDGRYRELFGEPKLNVMPEEERAQLEEEKARLVRELEGEGDET